MYRFAQRRVGIVAAVIIAALAIVSFAVFPGIYADPKGGPVSALLMVVAATAVAYLVLRFAAVRAEAVLVALRVRRGKIALARIDKIEELGEARDICLTPHRLCAFETEVFVPGGESFSCRIVEDIDKRFEVKTPAWVYVTYEGEAVRDCVGIVPTSVLFATPSLEPVVRELEKRCHPAYVEVSRGLHGLAMAPFKRKS